MENVTVVYLIGEEFDKVKKFIEKNKKYIEEDLEDKQYNIFIYNKNKKTLVVHYFQMKNLELGDKIKIIENISELEKIISSL